MKDGGCHLSSGIEALRELGCCPEHLYPYEPIKVNLKPPLSCYSEARHYRVTKAAPVRADLNEMKGCLAEGHPFVFGMELFASFMEAGTNGGRVKMPKQGGISGEARGWHAMMAVGYSDASQCFIVKNSWGSKWVSFQLNYSATCMY